MLDKTHILHISDLHFGETHAFKNQNGKNDTEQLATHITRDLKQNNFQPQCVVVSGDLTEKATSEEFDEAEKFLRSLSKKLNLEIKNFIFTPGNHDVDWTKTEQNTLLRNYQTFLRLIYGNNVLSDNKYLTLTWSNKHTFILSINSCAVEGPDHPGIGWVNYKQLEDAKNKFENSWNNCDVRIAVLHHHLVPVNWNSVTPEPPKKHSLTLNTEQIISWLIKNGFQLVLHGHQHQPFFAGETRYYEDTPNWNLSPHLLVFGAGSAGASDNLLGNIGRRSYSFLSVSSSGIDVISRSFRENDMNTVLCLRNIPILPHKIDLTFQSILNNLIRRHDQFRQTAVVKTVDKTENTKILKISI